MALRELGAHDNEIKSLPKEIGLLTNLTKLNVPPSFSFFTINSVLLNRISAHGQPTERAST